MGFVDDLRLALRALTHSAGFAGVVVLTLALGIRLNTAVFSVVNGVLLRALDYEGTDRLVYVQAHLEAEGTTDGVACAWPERACCLGPLRLWSWGGSSTGGCTK
jgi:hypothetical protein